MKHHPGTKKIKRSSGWYKWSLNKHKMQGGNGKIQYGANEGSVGGYGAIKRYPRRRRCKLCKKLLNIYNPGPYCLTHTFKGAIMEIEKKAALQDKERRQHKREVAKIRRKRAMKKGDRR